jgi:hypothetical protein
VRVSAGFAAGIRGKAAARLGPFMDRVRDLLPAVPVLYADETPARAAGKPHYVHVACTEFLTAMHTGDCTKEATDSGGILPGYAGTIVRDGYKGYEHLTDALHAWCGAHGLRDLAGLHRFDPDGQVWARSMADLLIDANARAGTARRAGQASPGDEDITGIRSWYRGAVAKGIADNQGKRTQAGKDGLRLARRFRDHEDMILRFATDWPSASPPTRPNATSAPSRSSSAPPAEPGAPSSASPTSPSSRPTCPPPPNGASTPSTPSPCSSPAAPGSRPQQPRNPGRKPRTAKPPPKAAPASGLSRMPTQAE